MSPLLPAAESDPRPSPAHVHRPQLLPWRQLARRIHRGRTLRGDQFDLLPQHRECNAGAAVLELDLADRELRDEAQVRFNVDEIR